MHCGVYIMNQENDYDFPADECKKLNIVIVTNISCNPSTEKLYTKIRYSKITKFVSCLLVAILARLKQVM